MLEKTGFMVFKYREYRFFWLAATFSNVGMWALIYGRLWLMHQLTDSPLMVGLATTASLSPILLFSLWGGVLADRVNRLHLLRITRGMFAGLAILTGVLIATHVIEPWHIIAISITTGILISFDMPSRAAMLPALVPRDLLPSAIVLYSLIFGGAAILGAAVFAPTVDLFGLGGVFFIIGIAYLLTVVTLSLMSPAPHRPQNHPPSILHGLFEGLSYVLHHKPIRGICIMGMIMGVFGSSFETLLPVFSDNIIAGGIKTYSRLLLFEGAGGLAGMTALIILGLRIVPARSYILSGVGFGIGLLILSQMDQLLVAAPVIAMLGGCRVVFQAMSTTLMQTLSSNELRGRVMSLEMFSWGSAALGGLLMGTIGQYVGVEAAMSLGGIIVVAGAVTISFLSLRYLLVGHTHDQQERRSV